MSVRTVRRSLLAALLSLCFVIPSLAQESQGAEEGTLRALLSQGTSIIGERMMNSLLERVNMRWQASYQTGQTVSKVNLGLGELLNPQPAGLEVSFTSLVPISVPVADICITAYTRSDQRLEVNGWKDLKGYRLACLSETPYIALQARINGLSWSSFSTQEELWEAIASRTADVAILAPMSYAPITPPKGMYTAGVLGTLDGFFYLHRSRAALVPALEEALRQMQDEGVLDTLKAGRLPDDGSAPIVIQLMSNDSEMEWERDFNSAFRGQLEGVEEPVFFRYNLDTRRSLEKEQQMEVIRQTLHTLLLTEDPMVIMCRGNAAAEFVSIYYQELFPGCPVVASAMDTEHLDAVYNTTQAVTGATESISASATIQFMLQLYPETRNIFVINDYTEIGRVWQGLIQKQVENLGLDVAIQYSENSTTAELVETVRTLGEDTLVLLGSWFTDSEQIYTSESKLQRELSAVLQRPLFSLLGSSVGSGALGGMVVSAQAQGRFAGELTSRILQGEDAASISAIYSSETLNEWLFDQNVAEKYGISLRDLPEGYRLLNAVPPVWEAYPKQTYLFGELAALLGVGLVLFFFLYNRGRKKIRRLVRENERMKGEGDLQEGNQAVMTQHNLLLLGNVMEHVPLAFAAVVEGTIISSNRYTRTAVGAEPGMKAVEVYNSPAAYQKIHRSLLESGMVYNQQISYRMKNGAVHRHLANYAAITYDGKPGYLSFSIDIQRLEEQRDYIKRTQNDLQKILDALPTALCIIEAEENTLLYANSAFLTLMGFAYFDVAKRFHYGGMMEKVFALWHGSSISFEYSDEQLAEKNLHIKMYADQINYDGKNCMVLIAQDVTAETHQAEILARAAEKERQANQLKSTFLANMSHEIRTPMNAIIGLSQLALMQGKPEEAADFFKKINDSANNLLSIINDILDFSKIEAEKMDFIEEPFCLEDTISNVFLVATERVEHKHVEVLLDMQPDVPTDLVGDKTRLWQVLKNIIDNAVKYTPEGHVMVEVQVESETTENITLRFNVRDTGVGMSPQQLNRLFTPFEQFHRDVSKKAGTGLGLAITHRLVKMMGGTITAKSEQGVGTEFSILIPFARAENHTTLLETLIAEVGDVSQAIGTILLVDDDECSLRIMSTILGNVGIQSVSTQDAASAMLLIKEREKQGKPFSVVIVDYMLGGDGEATGLDFARELGETTNNTRLLMVTAYLRRYITEEAIYEAGIRDIIEKPYIVSTFLKKICNILPEVSSKAGQQEERQSFSQARVLMCEDNELNQMIAQGVLEMYGIHPDIASNGKEGLALLEANPYDLVLMDVIMPVMDGLEATVAIRKSDKPYRDVPIVALTANVMTDDIEKYKSLGMNDHLEKPINVELFYRILKKYLE